ncbi:MAG: hypothetical protein ACERKT_08500, partial [Acidobacteriota bacterium]
MTRSPRPKPLAIAALILSISLSAAWIAVSGQARAADPPTAPAAVEGVPGDPAGDDGAYSAGDAYVPGEVIIQRK